VGFIRGAYSENYNRKNKNTKNFIRRTQLYGGTKLINALLIYTYILKLPEDGTPVLKHAGF